MTPGTGLCEEIVGLECFKPTILDCDVPNRKEVVMVIYSYFIHQVQWSQ